VRRASSACCIRLAGLEEGGLERAGFTLLRLVALVSSQGPWPALSAVSPSVGPPAGGIALTVTGTALRAGVRVFVGGRECAVAVDTPDANGTLVRCAMPSFTDMAEHALPFAADVTVVQTDETNATLTEAFLVQVRLARGDPAWIFVRTDGVATLREQERRGQQGQRGWRMKAIRKGALRRGRGSALLLEEK